jgi:hypothetical protein
MAVSYAKALKRTARLIPAGIFDSAVWGAIGTGLWAVFVLIVRLLMLLTYPVSAPCLAALVMLDERKYYARLLAKVQKEMA